MNLALTPTQLKAYIRRQNFRLSIERRAADLQAPRASAPVEALPDQLAPARALEPESFPAETDPPPAPPPPVVPPEPPAFRYPQIAEIKKAVAALYCITVADLESPRRSAHVVLPRQIAMYLCRHLTIRSMPFIGRQFGNRDHTTVLHAENKIRLLLPRDENVAFDVALLLEQITGQQQ